MSQKMENLLNLALETDEEVRARTENLNVGFDEESRSWELIVKYHGELTELVQLGIAAEELIAGYAILTVPERLVERVAAFGQIEYVEKPKRFFYSRIMPIDGICQAQVSFREPYLSGQGVLLAVLDSGIEYRREDFRSTDGSTRIRYLWDQTLPPDGEQYRPPEGFSMGVEFSREQINEALRAEDDMVQYRLLPSRDVSGHGTAVAGIAAASAGNLYSGVAFEAELLIVKLGLPKAEGFPRTTEIMRGVTYAVRKADELQMPLVINLSFGNSYGSHDGSSLLERFLDNAAEIGRTVICVGSGNEGNAGGHFAGNIESVQEAELAVAEYETSLSIQLWKHYSDVFRIYLRSPGGTQLELPFQVEQGKYTLTVDQTQVLVYMGEPLPYAVAQEIYLELLPQGRTFLSSGIWTIRLVPERVVVGDYYLYLPSGAARSENTRFYFPAPQVTLTIPSTASKVITVGAYNSVYDSYADFSGRGYGGSLRSIGVVPAGIVKPDLVAPGVNIMAPDVYGGYTAVTGTSFAAPMVSGAAALLMSWGIVRNNDPFLYGEKVKAYLRKGARALPGFTEYPNPQVGYGALCVRDSLPL